MDQREYSELCTRLGRTLTEFSVDFMDLGILLGSIRLMLDHPGTAEYGVEFRGMVGAIRETLLDAYSRMGLTTSQIHDLDTMYASEADAKAWDGFAEGFKDRSHLSIVDSREDEG